MTVDPRVEAALAYGRTRIHGNGRYVEETVLGVLAAADAVEGDQLLDAANRDYQSAVEGRESAEARVVELEAALRAIADTGPELTPGWTHWRTQAVEALAAAGEGDRLVPPQLRRAMQQKRCCAGGPMGGHASDCFTLT
jgi:hypothetical protein